MSTNDMIVATCAITNTPICVGDDVKLIILKSNIKNNGGIGIGFRNIYSTFEPVTLPISGRFSPALSFDIDDVEKEYFDYCYSSIRRYYYSTDVHLVDIIKSIAHGNSDKLSCMFVHTDMYNIMSDYIGNQNIGAGLKTKFSEDIDYFLDMYKSSFNDPYSLANVDEMYYTLIPTDIRITITEPILHITSNRIKSFIMFQIAMSRSAKMFIPAVHDKSIDYTLLKLYGLFSEFKCDLSKSI